MLVLSRKKYESIVIDDDTTVTVVEIRGDRVRLGVVAPKLVKVHRQEVWSAIQKAKNVQGSGQDATGPTPGGVSENGKAGGGKEARKDAFADL